MIRFQKIKPGINSGFTIVELVVATTLFVITMTALLSLFNYVLKINRRTEAIRQASQGMRNLVEFFVKEIRNGQIDYGIVNGQSVSTTWPIGPCGVPAPQVDQDTYRATENKLALFTDDGLEECIYLAYGPGAGNGNPVGNYVGATVFGRNTDSSSSNYNPNPIIAIQKTGV